MVISPLHPHFCPVEIATFGHTQAPISIAGACVSCGYAGAEAMAQQHRIHGIEPVALRCEVSLGDTRDTRRIPQLSSNGWPWLCKATAWGPSGKLQIVISPLDHGMVIFQKHRNGTEMVGFPSTLTPSNEGMTIPLYGKININSPWSYHGTGGKPKPLYHNFEWYKMIQVHIDIYNIWKYIYETLIGKDMYDSTINQKGSQPTKVGT